ncbi:uncharacterized protein LOC109800219 [Cajanus cajan]|uniref:uncharacterized protein LOC109800219 n=1 Tax=Cajanus cajan TaxID=3821 RepID=UPI00098D9EAD|nr:uncharacterized protein LOC109800219 [Cajanus cajan]
MEVQVVTPPTDLNLDSNCSSPFITAPSSPQRFANGPFFFSAPTSPTRLTSSVPFLWEQNPSQQDFEFNFTAHPDPPSLSADQLFHAGKIRPLDPPPSAEAATETVLITEQQERTRGRERLSASLRKGSRSLSPLRISDIVCDSQDKAVSVSSSTSNTKSSFLSSIPFTRKWRFRDFLLFRSASEGRATDKDPLRKYVALSNNDDVPNSSFRSTESSGSVSKRRGPVSAHELHYTLNRAASEELKKKTPLPYKQGLLGCLGFNPGMHHHISKGIGSFTRS